MNCSTCHGTGRVPDPWFSPLLDGPRINDRSVQCLECRGRGVVHCCEGDRVQPDVDPGRVVEFNRTLESLRADFKRVFGPTVDVRTPPTPPRDYFEPVALTCRRCDFGTGQRGMDRCGTCDGTGSIFWVAGQSLPNTERGYLAARAILAGAR